MAKLNNPLNRDMKSDLQGIVILFGAAQDCENDIKKMHQCGHKIFKVFDNDHSKWNSFLCDVEICEPKLVEGAVVIIMARTHYREITAQLVNIGYTLSDIYTIDNVRIYFKELNMAFDDYPSTLQFPTTYKCNYDCIMCGMRNTSEKKEMTSEEFSNVIANEIFDHITSVGINGGEPFIRDDISEYIEILTKRLGDLKSIDVISNGSRKEEIIRQLKRSRKICDKNSVSLNLSISIDGVEKTHDAVRGKKGAFKHAEETLDCILTENGLIDELSIICTITARNAYNLYELEEWADKKGVIVEYNIASPIARLNNFEKVEKVSVLSNKLTRSIAAEFFYEQYVKTGKEKYFGLFLYLTNNKRFTYCPYMTASWITLSPDGKVSFCPPRGIDVNPFTFGMQDNYEKEMCKVQRIFTENCESCAHYGYRLSAEGYSILFRDDMKNDNAEWRKWEYA